MSINPADCKQIKPEVALDKGDEAKNVCMRYGELTQINGTMKILTQCVCGI